MADSYADTAPASQPTGQPRTPDSEMQRYMREVARYDKATAEWREDGENIVKVYLDEGRTASSPRRFALLWSNVETLKPAVYVKAPVVNCSRRFKDPDPVARTAAEILERAVNSTFENYNVDETFRMVRDDRLLPGRGQAWVRYEAQFEPIEPANPAADDADGADSDQDSEQPGETLAHECVRVDYVHWTDFGHNVARTWNDVWLVWRRVYKSRDEVVERFGEDVAKLCVYDAKPAEDKEDGADGKACLYEFWDRRRNKVVWIAKGAPKVLEVGPPPIKFRKFFPCPEPCYATKTSKSLVPVPDYRYYRDQTKEINDLTEKIASLTEWLVVKGFVPGDAAGAIERALRNSGEALLVQVESWTEFASAGGAKGLIEWLPIEPIIATLKAAIEARAQIIQDVYQETGISDVLRGQTDPNETLGAQELKSQAGSRRVRNTKDEISRFCRDIGEMVAEVIADLFQPQTLADMSGFKYQPMPVGPLPGMQPQGIPTTPQGNPASSPMVFDDQVLQLLRDDRMRGFRIDIETDSTIQLDENAEKQARMEFLTSIGAFMQPAIEALQQAPQLAPAMGEILMFAVRGFRAGRSLEESIEKAMGQLSQMASAPKPPSPDEIKAKLETDKMQAGMAADQAETQHKERMAAAERIEAGNQHQRAAELHDWKMKELARQANIEDAARLDEQLRRAQEHSYKLAETDRQTRLKERDGEMMHAIATIKADREKSAAERDSAQGDMQAAQGEHQASAQGMTAIAQAIQQMVQQQGEQHHAHTQAFAVMLDGLGRHMSEQTKTQREIAAQHLKVAAAPRKLIKNADGSKHTEIMIS